MTGYGVSKYIQWVTNDMVHAKRVKVSQDCFQESNKMSGKIVPRKQDAEYLGRCTIDDASYALSERS